MEPYYKSINDRNFKKVLGLAGALGFGAVLGAGTLQVESLRALCMRCAEVGVLAVTSCGVLAVAGEVYHRFELRRIERRAKLGALGFAPAPQVSFGFSVPAVGPRPEVAQPEAVVLPVDRVEAWEAAVIRFGLAGKISGGYGWGTMRQHCGRKAWREIVGLLTSTDPPVFEPARGNIPPTWAAGWTLPRLRCALRSGDLLLAYDGPAPVIRI